MKYLLCFLLLALPLNVFAATKTLEWDAVTKDVNGNLLAAPPMYRIYTTMLSGNYLSYRGLTSSTRYVFTETRSGTHYAIVRAYNEGGESGNSNEISFQIPFKPGNVSNVRVQ